MPNEFGVTFPLGGKSLIQLRFDISLSDTPGPCSPVTHMIIGEWMGTFVCAPELRAPCSLLQKSAMSSAGGEGEPRVQRSTISTR